VPRRAKAAVRQNGSSKKRVQKLYLGEGQEFRGEGILAVTKALLQAGVS